MELAHDRAGSGPPLVLIHGIGSRRGAWDPVVAHLTAERETIAIDLPGFGDSPILEGTPSVAGLADAVQAFFDAHGLDRPHVAGNSLGGGIALELARRGSVRSAAALSPIGFWSRAEQRYGEAVLRLSHALATHAQGPVARLTRSAAGRRIAFGLLLGRPERRDPADALLDVQALAAATGWSQTLPRLRDYDGRTGPPPQAPVTIGWGTKDYLLIPRQAERARAALPQARHVPLPGCGHVPMSDDPVGVAALLLAASG